MTLHPKKDQTMLALITVVVLATTSNASCSGKDAPTVGIFADTVPRLAFEVGTQDVVVGQVIDPGFVIRVRDAIGAPYGAPVAMAAFAFDEPGAVGGRTTTTAVDGIARFDSLVALQTGSIKLTFRATAFGTELSYTLTSDTAPPSHTDPSAADSTAPFRYDRAAPLALQVVPSGSPDPALAVSRISFASPSGGRATGWLVVPPGPGPHAGVVLLHGLPGNAEGMAVAYGLEHARRGAVVLAIDAPWVRRSGLPDFTVRDSVEQVQLIHDLQRAVDVLVARPDVDAARIGFVGGSYGGAMGTLFIAMETRLRAAILFVPDGGLVAHFTQSDGTPIGPLTTVPAEQQSRWLDAMRPIEPIRFAAMSEVPAILVQNGRNDQLVAAEDAIALHNALPSRREVLWYESTHALPPQAVLDRHAWFAAKLGTRP